MRVTKVIKEFIETKVKEKYADRLKAPTAQYYAEQEIINAKAKTIIRKADADLKAFLRAEYPDWAAANDGKTLATYNSPSNSEMFNRGYQLSEKIRRERDAQINEIILNLELGGGRAELEEMLEKI